MASVGMVKETDEDVFEANKTTKLFAQPGYHGGIHHMWVTCLSLLFIITEYSSSFDTLGPTQQALPDLLISTSHQNPDATSRTALQVAFDTQLPPFKWFPTQPERFAHFQQLMTVQRNASTWLSVFPLASEMQDWNPTAPDQALFVDVGGGFGQQCEAFQAAAAATGLALKGRIVLQELPATLERAPALEGVEFQAHDFFTEQPVKGMNPFSSLSPKSSAGHLHHLSLTARLV